MLSDEKHTQIREHRQQMGSSMSGWTDTDHYPAGSDGSEPTVWC